MPLEIRELHIKVTVNQPPKQQEGGLQTAGSGTKTEEDKEAIINQCVEEVLHILQNKKER